MNSAVGESTKRNRFSGVRWITWPLAMLLVAAVIILTLIWLGRSNPAIPSQTPQNGGAGAATQRNEGGGVTVAVEWAGKDAGPVFKVTMDTHSVDLDGYDLTRLSTLRTADGREALPLTWDAPKGGHHRAGTLTFSTNALDGKPLIDPNTKGLELVIYNVAGVAERSFKWTP